MFEHWGEFYLVAGGAAAVLIGLIFVVVTLMHDRPRSSVLQGSKLYMGPIVLHMCFVLVLSGAALTLGITNRAIAAIAAIIALWGTARGVYSIGGIRRLRIDDVEVRWTDAWYYGAIPTAIYLALAAVALGLWGGSEWAPYGLAGVVVALLLVSIRDEYDLVTWLAPKPDAGD